MARHLLPPSGSRRPAPGRDSRAPDPRARNTGSGLLRAVAGLAVVVLILLTGWLHSSGRWPFGVAAGPAPVVETAAPGLGRPVYRVGRATAVAVLATLAVKGKAPRTNYDRSAFGEAWLDADANGCDTRNDVLRRDLGNVTLAPGSPCLVAAGTFQEPYTDRPLAFTRGATTSAGVQIDHVVALGNAWATGAQQLSAVQRQSLANDPLNLLAVDGAANQDKSDSDAATWLPPSKKFRCQYVARQISVKAAYGLWVTPAERDAMTTVLGRCPGEPSLPSGYGP
ncbi:HNH endonuclease family protein [Specibacter sp. RAF43]|uniref:HNH endonuclease family protein n=1 Tax=Specibacter sp. RAF43 TaxID=3233057 RepID=UPI003F9A535F